MPSQTSECFEQPLLQSRCESRRRLLTTLGGGAEQLKRLRKFCFVDSEDIQLVLTRRSLELQSRRHFSLTAHLFGDDVRGANDLLALLVPKNKVAVPSHDFYCQHLQ